MQTWNGLVKYSFFFNEYLGQNSTVTVINNVQIACYIKDQCSYTDLDIDHSTDTRFQSNVWKMILFFIL
jgi:hypothetical protein